MGIRVASALLAAALLAGCAENQQITGLNALAMATPEPAQAQADPSFRLNELKPGMTKAELEAIYPNRMVLDRTNSYGTNQYYFVEPLNVTTGSKVVRDRLGLFVSDGKLAAFGMMSSNEEVMGATEIAPAAPRAPKAPPPPGKYGVQVGARNSEAEARALIDEMRAKYPVLLGQQWAAIHRVSLPQGFVYRVVIGPLGSPQQAEKLCLSLKAQGAECILQKV